MTALDCIKNALHDCVGEMYITKRYHGYIIILACVYVHGYKNSQDSKLTAAR